MAMNLFEIYWNRRQSTGTSSPGCVNEQGSCSVRAFAAFQAAVTNGEKPGPALAKALEKTTETCADINHISKAEAATRLFLGTAAVMVGAGVVATSICPDGTVTTEIGKGAILKEYRNGVNTITVPDGSAKVISISGDEASALKKKS